MSIMFYQISIHEEMLPIYIYIYIMLSRDTVLRELYDNLKYTVLWEIPNEYSVDEEQKYLGGVLVV